MTLPSGIINLLKDELNNVDWKRIHESIGGKINKYKDFCESGWNEIIICVYVIVNIVKRDNFMIWFVFVLQKMIINPPSYRMAHYAASN